MKRYAVLNSNGDLINTIIYDGVAKYKVDNIFVLKNIENIKFKYAEPGDKIVGDSLNKKEKKVIDLDVVK